jgi:hypothetical protein
VLLSQSIDACTVLYLKIILLSLLARFEKNTSRCSFAKNAYIIVGGIAAATPLAAAHQRHSGRGEGERVANLAAWKTVLQHFSLNYCSQHVRIHQARHERPDVSTPTPAPPCVAKRVQLAFAEHSRPDPLRLTAS